MKIKSYFANTVEGAMAAAREELGPDAMLVNSRKSSPDARHLGAYEVVFVTDLPDEEKIERATHPAPDLTYSAADRLTQQVADLTRELEGMRRTITRSALAPAAGRDLGADGSEAYGALVAQDVPAEMAREIVRAAEAAIHGPTSSQPRLAARGEGLAFQNALRNEIESRITAEAALGRGESRPRIVALVGPPGSGKTTTLVKLAVNYGLAARRPVLLLSIDTYRVGAAEQLRAYATILGVHFQLAETVPALAQAIEEHRGKELIFIDTPGLGGDELRDYSGLAQFLSTRADVDTQLVVPGSMKPADLTHTVDRYDVFCPRRLIFTRLDETNSYGPILSEAARTGKGLSFFATGQRIPEDLEAATRRRLAELLLDSRQGLALSAA